MTNKKEDKNMVERKPRICEVMRTVLSKTLTEIEEIGRQRTTASGDQTLEDIETAFQAWLRVNRGLVATMQSICKSDLSKPCPALEKERCPYQVEDIGILHG
ncbi:hypothetical protein HYU95_03385 [Candidatus Daviesbacteria bacterium]|nr:hypothetical protein [Candidatus Daviesbacteria bacterium]